MKLQGMLRLATVVVVACAAAGGAASEIDTRFTVHDLSRQQAKTLAASSAPARAPARAAATWCGTPGQADLAPNAVAGNPVHWVYAVPSDGPDRFASFGSVMQTDAESIDAWWRSQDPLRAPRNDLAPFSCGSQLDLTLFRLTQSSSQLSSIDARFGAITSSLLARGFGSRHTKYLVYYDGPVEPDICGQGGSNSSGLGFAVVYVQACPGVPWNTTAAHELLHTLGAVATGAPHMCPVPDYGHVCDNALDLMYPFGDETPITGLSLDSGRDDYYGHAGSWPDTQDSPWLVQLDRQVPFALTVSGSGSVTGDVPGLRCSQSCTTTWSAGTTLELSATPTTGTKLVGWGASCSGRSTCKVVVEPGKNVSATFALETYRLTVAVTGQGSVRSSLPGIACPSRCSSLVPSYEAMRLTPAPAKGWRLQQWSGACRGKGVCSVPMTSATSARAEFVRR
ncbi:MAG: InlB B-repeat-containing protein [Gaiellaceae bacterium]